MKISLILWLILSSLYSNISGQPSAPVLDTDGKEVQAGVYYYVDTYLDFAGGLTPSRTGHGFTYTLVLNADIPLDTDKLVNLSSQNVCPPDFVTQDPMHGPDGTPVKFRPFDDPEDGVVRLSTDLNVAFNVSSSCENQTPLWKLDYEEIIGADYVSTGGVEGNPGRETLNNWFKIQEFKHGYMFVFCPSVCDACKPECGNLTMVEREHIKLLELISSFQTLSPLPVGFRRP